MFATSGLTPFGIDAAEAALFAHRKRALAEELGDLGGGVEILTG